MRLSRAALLAPLWLIGCGHASCPEPISPESVPCTPPASTHGHLHGEHHAFDDPEKWAAQWDTKERDAWQKPDRVLALLKLSVDMVVAEVGTGTGYFAVRMAERVPAGHVWAVDVQPAMVRHVNERARDKGLDNLFAILGRHDDPMLPERAEVVLMVNTYHHIEDRPAYLQRLREYLASGGRLVIVDFMMGKRPVGPPDTAKVAPEEVLRELAAAGYKLLRDDRKSLPHQYILIAGAQE
jgi:SAM-dependent methyltransferase